MSSSHCKFYAISFIKRQAVIKLQDIQLGSIYGQLLVRLESATSSEEILNIYRNFPEKNNPLLHALTGGQFNTKYPEADEALSIFIKGASMGIKFPSDNWNVTYVDSIGKCISQILFLSKLKSGDLFFRLFSLAYVYASAVIFKMPASASDSYPLRGSISASCSAVANEFYHQYYSNNSLIQVFVLADYFTAAKVFHWEGIHSEASKYLDWAKQIHGSIKNIQVAGKEANEYSLEEIANIGMERHIKTYLKVLPLAIDGKFDISDEEFAYFCKYTLPG